MKIMKYIHTLPTFDTEKWVRDKTRNKTPTKNIVTWLYTIKKKH